MIGSEIVDVSMRVFQALGWTMLRVSAGPCLFCLAVITLFSYPGEPSGAAAQKGKAAPTEYPLLAVSGADGWP